MKSYARALALWWRWLQTSQVGWRDVGLSEFTGFVHWLRTGEDGTLVAFAPSAPKLSESTVAVRLQAVLSFYRYQALNGVPAAVALTQRIHRSSPQFRPLLEHVRVPDLRQVRHRRHPPRRAPAPACRVASDRRRTSRAVPAQDRARDARRQRLAARAPQRATRPGKHHRRARRRRTDRSSRARSRRPSAPRRRPRMSEARNDRSQVLRAAAARKHHDAVQRAERAIRQLVKEGRPVTFKAVAQHAPCSTAFLYGHTELKRRITHLREQHRKRDAPRPASRPRRPELGRAHAHPADRRAEAPPPRRSRATATGPRGRTRRDPRAPSQARRATRAPHPGFGFSGQARVLRRTA